MNKNITGPCEGRRQSLPGASGNVYVVSDSNRKGDIPKWKAED